MKRLKIGEPGVRRGPMRLKMNEKERKQEP